MSAGWFGAVRLAASTAALCCCVVLPAFGQQAAPATGAAEARQQIQAVAAKWMKSLNDGDAKSLASLCASDCVAINARGMVIGSDQLERNVDHEIKSKLRYSRFETEVVHLTGADTAVAAGPYSVVIGDSPPINGTWLQVYSRSGGTWKIVAASFTRLAGSGSTSGAAVPK